MCFTPTISLITASIEFILATILLLFFRRTLIRDLFVAAIYLLGIYQFTEFMICSGFSPFTWALIGFISYSFLPAIGLHVALKSLKKKAKIFWIYILPVLASLIAMSNPRFITQTTCSEVFVQVQTIFSTSNSFLLSLLFIIYITYYFGFIFLTGIFFYNDYKKQKNELKKEIDLVEISGILLMTIPTVLLILIFPYLGVKFPSVLCGFAIFIAIAAFIAVYLEDKLYKKRTKKLKKK